MGHVSKDAKYRQQATSLCSACATIPWGFKFLQKDLCVAQLRATHVACRASSLTPPRALKVRVISFSNHNSEPKIVPPPPPQKSPRTKRLKNGNDQQKQRNKQF
eukprot:5503619-Amphidinium_carterae.1